MMKKYILLILALIIFAIWSGDYLFAQKERTRISTTIMVTSKDEALKQARAFLDSGYKNVYICKTVWHSDIEKGYQYEVEGIKYSD